MGNFCRSLRKFRNCIKKRCKTSAFITNQDLPQNTTEFNQKIQSSTQKGPMNSAIYRQLLGTTEPNKCDAHRIAPHRDPIQPSHTQSTYSSQARKTLVAGKTHDVIYF